MTPSKSTDKLMALQTLMEDMPTERTKVFQILWKEIEGMAVPFVNAEFYEEKGVVHELDE